MMLIEAKLLRTRPKSRGRGQGRGQLVEAKAEDKISASRTVWPRGLNITGSQCNGQHTGRTGFYHTEATTQPEKKQTKTRHLSANVTHAV